MYSNNTLGWGLYGAGLLIVFGTHVYMLTVGLLPEQMTAHAVVNIVAAFLLVGGWLSRKT